MFAKKIGLIELNPARGLFAPLQNNESYRNIDYKLSVFKDGEVETNLLESVRGLEVIIAGETDNPLNIMKLIISIDATKRAGAREIHVITPYFGYSRQDKKHGQRSSIGAKAIMDMLKTAGTNSVYTIDLHADAIEGFFDGRVSHISGVKIFGNEIRSLLSSNPDEKFVLCSPDSGGIARVAKFGKEFNLGYVNCNKVRSEPNVVGTMTLNGDVNGKHVILVDDIGDTLGTVKSCVKLLKEYGALSVHVFLTHAIFTGIDNEKVKEIGANNIFVSNSIYKPSLNELDINVVNCFPEICSTLNSHFIRF